MRLPTARNEFFCGVRRKEELGSATIEREEDQRHGLVAAAFVVAALAAFVVVGDVVVVVAAAACAVAAAAFAVAGDAAAACCWPCMHSPTVALAGSMHSGFAAGIVLAVERSPNLH